MRATLRASLLPLHLGLGRGADIDYSDTPGELGQTLLQLFAIIVPSGFLDLTPDLVNSALDIFGRTFALNYRRVFFVDGHALGSAQIIQRDVFELDPKVLGYTPAARQDCNVFQHRLAPVTESRGLNSRDLKRATQLVYHQGGKCFAFHIFGDNQQRTTRFGHFLKQRKQIFQAGDLLLMDQDVRVLEHNFHVLRVRHEVRRQVTLIELHALHHFEGGFDPFCLLNGDRAVLANLVHRIADDLADRGIPIGRNGCDLSDLLPIRHFLGDLLEFLDDHIYRLQDTALQRGRIRAGGHILEPFAEDGLGQNRWGRRAITRHIRGLGSDLADQLGSHIFVRGLELDFLPPGDAVFWYCWS